MLSYRLPGETKKPVAFASCLLGPVRKEILPAGNLPIILGVKRFYQYIYLFGSCGNDATTD